MGDIPPEEEASWEEVSSVHMSGNWTFHAYKLSHDRRSNVIYLPDGFEIHAKGREVQYELPGIAALNPRDVLWHPDNDIFCFWAPPAPGKGRRIALIRLNRLPRPGDGEPYEIVYDPAEHSVEGEQFIPFGIEWSPSGKALYVLGRIFYRDPSSPSVAVLKRLTFPAGQVQEILRVPGQIDFFMPPVSRFQNGSGSSSKDYRIIYGTAGGLFTTDPSGLDIERVSTVPAIGLHNVEWSPVANKVVLYFRRAAVGIDGRSYRGVWLVDLDKAKAGKEAAEQLYERTDIHTLWFSPHGTYVSWASEAEVAFRRPDDPADKTVHLTAESETGSPLDIKGMSWHDSERYLAFTAGNRLFIYDVEAEKQHEVARFGVDALRFAAEPEWRGDHVFLTVFEDRTAEMEELKRHILERQEKDDD